MTAIVIDIRLRLLMIAFVLSLAAAGSAPARDHGQYGDTDPAIKEWSAFMDKYFPEGDKSSTFTVYGYATAQTMVQVLKQCGDDLTRENVMRQAANLKNLELPMLLPGIRINTSQTDYLPVKQLRLQRFDGKQWVLFGEVIGN